MLIKNDFSVAESGSIQEVNIWKADEFWAELVEAEELSQAL